MRLNHSARWIALILIAVSSLSPASSAANEPASMPPVVAEAQISTVESRRHVDSLASDRLLGRMTGEAGLDTAASYIASELAAAGVEPFNGSWLHAVPLKRANLGLKTGLKVGSTAFPLKESFVPFDFTEEDSVAGRVAFVGYGLSLPDSGYDDYAGLDVRGRIVVAVAGEPQRLVTTRGGRGSWSQAREKMRQAAARGAVGILIVGDPRHSGLLRPTGYPWPSLYASVPESALRVRLDLPDSGALPAASINGRAARAILGAVFDSLPALLDRIDSLNRPASSLLNIEVEMLVELTTSRVATSNVVGVIRGSADPEEYVVVGAHYDHIGSASLAGMAGFPSATDTVYNGADDNASGTAALLLVARAFASLPVDQRPARSVLVVAFSAEEVGLFGSRAFVATSGIPARTMAAMLNLDMVGRNAPDSLSVGGLATSPELRDLVRKANEVEPFVLAENIESHLYRSDQAPFARAGVPVAFFHSGEHEDYHRASDESDRIDHSKLAHVARLVFRTAWLLAAAEQLPSFVPPAKSDPASFILDY